MTEVSQPSSSNSYLGSIESLGPQIVWPHRSYEDSAVLALVSKQVVDASFWVLFTNRFIATSGRATRPLEESCTSLRLVTRVEGHRRTRTRSPIEARDIYATSGQEGWKEVWS